MTRILERKSIILLLEVEFGLNALKKAAFPLNTVPVYSSIWWGQVMLIFPKKHSTQYASHVLKDVWCLAKDLGYEELFIDVSNYAVEDDHLYVNTIAKIPMIDIINYRASASVADHWHTEKDNIDIIDANTLHAVRQVVLLISSLHLHRLSCPHSAHPRKTVRGSGEKLRHKTP